MNFAPVLIFFFLSGCQISQNESIADICPDKDFSQQVSSVSLKNLKQIKELNGSFIQVDGVFHYNFEDVALYPSNRSEAKSAMWVNFKIPDSNRAVQLEKMNGKRVTLIGRLNLAENGHLNYYFGELDSVFCIKLNR